MLRWVERNGLIPVEKRDQRKGAKDESVDGPSVEAKSQPETLFLIISIGIYFYGPIIHNSPTTLGFVSTSSGARGANQQKYIVIG
jgi:hypothetical protein